MSSQTQPQNWSYHAIAAAYGFMYIPHGYYIANMMSVAKDQATNITPRYNLATLKGKIPAETWSKLARARGCHFNALEGFPLFATAMIIGNMAKMPASEMNTLAAEYLGVRILYNVLYMTARSEAASYLRSGVYGVSVGIPIYELWKAANRLM